MVVFEYAEDKAVFIVDRFLCEFQSVLIPLGKSFVHSKGGDGLDRIGTGKIAVIFDVSKLVELIDHKD